MPLLGPARRGRCRRASTGRAAAPGAPQRAHLLHDAVELARLLRRALLVHGDLLAELARVGRPGGGAPATPGRRGGHVAAGVLADAAANDDGDGDEWSTRRDRGR